MRTINQEVVVGVLKSIMLFKELIINLKSKQFSINIFYIYNKIFLEKMSHLL